MCACVCTKWNDIEKYVYVGVEGVVVVKYSGRWASKQISTEIVTGYFFLFFPSVRPQASSS